MGFLESRHREERPLRLSGQHENGRPRVDIQRSAGGPSDISSWRGLFLQSEALGQVLFVSVLCLSRSSFCGEASQSSDLDERCQGLAGCLALPLGKACS